jgi:hypothetical protein
MDNGEEIQGLEEGWTFLGAKISEWCAGIAVFVMIGEVFFKGRMNSGIPIMAICGVGTAIALTRLRKTFPDEEKGVVNHFCVLFGFTPPGVPTPAELQDHWSGTPCAKLDADCEFVKLGLHDVFFPTKDEDEE